MAGIPVSAHQHKPEDLREWMSGVAWHANSTRQFDWLFSKVIGSLNWEPNFQSLMM